MTVDRRTSECGRLVGCMVHNERLSFWLNQRTGSPAKPDSYEGLRLYWTPGDIHDARERLLRLGYPAWDIINREYGQSEFFVTDDDGYAHCFGVATEHVSKRNRDGSP